MLLYNARPGNSGNRVEDWARISDKPCQPARSNLNILGQVDNGALFPLQSRRYYFTYHKKTKAPFIGYAFPTHRFTVLILATFQSNVVLNSYLFDDTVEMTGAHIVSCRIRRFGTLGTHRRVWVSLQRRTQLNVESSTSRTLDSSSDRQFFYPLHVHD